MTSLLPHFLGDHLSWNLGTLTGLSVFRRLIRLLAVCAAAFVTWKFLAEPDKRSESDGPATGVAEQATRKRDFPNLLVIQGWGPEDTVAVVLIFFVAALLRLIHLNYMEFKGDEASTLFLAVDFVSAKAFPLVGIGSSLGTYNPPLFTYLMGIPMLFSRNPVIAAGFIAILDSVAVGLTYVFCRRYFGRITAIVASVFFAISPWAVFYSRKIWQQDLLPIFVIGFFFGLFAVVFDGREKHLLTCCACLAAATQLHFSSIYLLVVLVLVLAWFRPELSWSDYLKANAITLLIYAPYVQFDLRNRGYNARIYWHTLRLPPHFRPEALTTPFTLASTLGFIHFVDWRPLDVLQVLFLVAGIIYLFFRMRNPKYAVLLLWFGVPTAFLLMSKVVLYPHYFIFLYPIQFVIMGVMAEALIRNPQPRKNVLGYATVALLTVLAAYQLQATLKLLTSITSHEELPWVLYGPAYGPPFIFRVQEIRDLAQQGIVAPDEVQKKLVEGKPLYVVLTYDFSATQYIIKNLSALP